MGKKTNWESIEKEAVKKAYDNLKQEFDAITDRYEKERGGLDSVWIAVKFPRSQWRLAKSVGAKKDCYYGWILWSSSVQSMGSNCSVEIQALAVKNQTPYKEGTNEYQTRKKSHKSTRR